ncbi:hypothetical protein ACWD1Y_31765 [Streptomyces sp. NPDC002814]
MPIVLGQEVYGLHLPHARSVGSNGSTAMVNNRYYLAKRPRLELELALAFGWLETDRIMPGIQAELEAVTAQFDPGHALGTVLGTVNGNQTLAVGAAVDHRAGTLAPEASTLFDPGVPLTVSPLAGFALPHSDGEIGECHVLPPVTELSARYRDTILREAERVAKKVSTTLARTTVSTGYGPVHGRPVHGRPVHGAALAGERYTET